MVLKTRKTVRKISSDLAVYIDLHFPESNETVAQRTSRINADPFVVQKRDELRKLHFYDGLRQVVNGERLIKMTVDDVADFIREDMKLRDLAEVCNVFPSKMVQLIRRDRNLQTLWQTRIAIRSEVVCKLDDGPVKRYKSVGSCAKDLGVSSAAISSYITGRNTPHGFTVWHEKDYLQMLEDKFRNKAMVGDSNV